MELFLQPQDIFEKLATTRMPEDPNAWPQEILQQLFKEVPYMSDFSPHVTMDKVDAEKGYAFGHITVMNQSETQLTATPESQHAAGLRQVRIPIVIRDGELSPLDLLITDDSRVLPLTESRLRSAIFRPQAFDVTSKTPGDQSMIGQLYPPFRQNFGLAGGAGGGGVSGMGAESTSKMGSAFEAYLMKEALKLNYNPDGHLTFDTEEDKKVEQTTPEVSGDMGEDPVSMAEQQAPIDTMGTVGGSGETAKMGSLLQAISHTMNGADLESFRQAVRNQDVRLAYEKNASVNLDCIRILFERVEQPKHKLASVLPFLLKPSVLQLVKLGTGYQLQTANHRCWAPQVSVLSRGEALKKLGSMLVMAADISGATTISDTEGVQEEPAVQPETGPAGPITDFGLYTVQTTNGQELVGHVIPNLIDINGLHAPIALFTNGEASAVQGEIIGTPAGDPAKGLPTGDMPNGYGSFADLDGQEVQATIPMRLHGSFESEGQPAVFSGETYDGRAIEITLQPNLQEVVAMEEGRMLVPEHWRWLPLGDSEAVALLSSEEETPKEAAARQTYASVKVASSGETFSFQGHALDKFAADQRQFLDIDGAMFLLAGLGVNQEYGIQKLSQATTGSEPVTIRIGRGIKLAEERAEEASVEARQIMSRMPPLRQDLFKEAGFITDPEAVDTVLSLGFINPENVTTFMNYMPTIEKTQESLCNLLFASRVGLSDVPESALETSVRTTEEVLEGLKTIAFQGPPSHS